MASTHSDGPVPPGGAHASGMLKAHPPVPAEVDAIFIGGGHNALVCANYLARAGLTTLVLESQGHIGGGVMTAEVTLPLFKHNLHAFFVRLTPSFRIWRDLRLSDYGLETIMPEVQNSVPFREGGGLVTYRSLDRSLAEIARFSPGDARRYQELFSEYATLVEQIVEPLRLAPPLDPEEEQALLQRTAAGRRYLELTKQPALDLCLEAFETEALRAMMLFNIALRGYLPVMDAPGTGYIFMMALTNSHNVGCVKGGSQQAALAIARALYDAGGRITTNTRVGRILVEQDRATGVELEDGRVIRARRAVISNLTAELTFMRLIGRDHLSASLAAAADNYQWNEEALFGVHLALNDVPRYRGSDGNPDLYRALNMCVGYETSADVITHMREIRAGQVPTRPAFHSSIPSVTDPSQAPPGHHTTFAWQFVPSRPADGGKQRWESEAEPFAERIVQTWREYAPNLAEAEMARFVHSPLDTERFIPSMLHGDRHHGLYHPSNFGYNRPHPDLSGYRTPIAGLYLCGAGMHPGGSFHGYPGYNAAGVVARDLGLDLWWQPQDVRTALRLADA